MKPLRLLALALAAVTTAVAGQPILIPMVEPDDSVRTVCGAEPFMVSIPATVDSTIMAITWKWNDASDLSPQVVVHDSTFHTITVSTRSDGVLQAWVTAQGVVQHTYRWSIYRITQPVIRGAVQSCVGDTLVLSTDSAPGIRYWWRIDHGIVLSDHDDPEVSILLTEWGTRYVTLVAYSDDSTCSDSTTVEFRMPQIPFDTIRGPDRMEVNTIRRYYADPHFFGDLQWSASRPSTRVVPGVPNSSVSIHVQETGRHELYLSITYADGCVKRDTHVVMVDSVLTSIRSEHAIVPPHQIAMKDGQVVVISEAPDDILSVDLIDVLGRHVPLAIPRWGTVTQLRHDDLTGPIFVAIHTRSHGIITAKVLLR